jgi:hypothetical protein
MERFILSKMHLFFFNQRYIAVRKTNYLWWSHIFSMSCRSLNPWLLFSLLVCKLDARCIFRICYCFKYYFFKHKNRVCCEMQQFVQKGRGRSCKVFHNATALMQNATANADEELGYSCRTPEDLPSRTSIISR